MPGWRQARCRAPEGAACVKSYDFLEEWPTMCQEARTAGVCQPLPSMDGWLVEVYAMAASWNGTSINFLWRNNPGGKRQDYRASL